MIYTYYVYIYSVPKWRFALGDISDVFLVGENPTCSVPAL